MHNTPAILKPSGYTLIELVTVVAILGIVALIAIPQYSSFNDEQKVSTAASELSNALSFARERAINTGLAHDVVIDTDKESFLIKESTSTLPIINPVDKKEYNVVFSDDSTMMSGVDILRINDVTGSVTTTFGKFGQASVSPASNTIAIPLSYRSFTKTVNVDAMTGRVSVK